MEVILAKIVTLFRDFSGVSQAPRISRVSRKWKYSEQDSGVGFNAPTVAIETRENESGEISIRRLAVIKLRKQATILLNSRRARWIAERSRNVKRLGSRAARPEETHLSHGYRYQPPSSLEKDIVSLPVSIIATERTSAEPWDLEALWTRPGKPCGNLRENFHNFRETTVSAILTLIARRFSDLNGQRRNRVPYIHCRSINITIATFV